MACPGEDRRSVGEPLETIAVKRANARERRIRRMTQHTHMPYFGMHQPMHRTPMVDDAAANAGADGDVHQARESPSGAPAQFGERRCVHVRIETERAAESALQGSQQIGVLPAGFRGARDEPVLRRVAAQIDRAECGQAERPNTTVARLGAGEEAHYRRQRGRRTLRLDARLRHDPAVTVAHGADEFRAARLDGTEQVRGFAHGR